MNKTNDNETAALTAAILRLHGAKATHVETVPVRETFRGQTVWDGAVDVFDLEDHPTAKRCYAWAHEADSGGRRYLAVLHAGPVDSPRKAVQAAIVAEHRGKTGGPK